MADSLSKISAMLESARELTLEAASSASARLMDETPLKPKDISALLNGKSDREKLSGMKQVIAMMAKGSECLEFFPDVIKNIASHNVETRKLVYTYLLRYADHEPDMALLSINTIQKSLGDQSPLIRALAVRVMSSIRVPVIAQIVSLAIKQCTNDLSPIVRRAAAFSIAKCYHLDPSNGPQMQELLEKLLKDNSIMVVSASLVTLQKTFPDRLDLIHGIYRNICRNLTSFDEWSLITILEMLTRYARMYLPKPKCYKPAKTEDNFLDKDKLGEEVELEEASEKDVVKCDQDLDLLFDNASSLLYNRNGGVVLAAAKLYFYLGGSETFVKYTVAGPLVRLLRSDSAVQEIALSNIRTMALTRSFAFKPYLRFFYAFPTESNQVSKYKIQILTLLCNNDNVKAVLSELKYYALNEDEEALVNESMKAIGICAIEIPNQSMSILKWLLKQVQSTNTTVVSEALSVIRVLVQRDFENQVPTVVRLAKSLNSSLAVPSAKAAIIWLVGELASTAHEVAVEVLRTNVKTFPQQDESVRYQLVLLAAKIYSCHLDRKNSQEMEADTSSADEFIPLLFDHVMHLARYDPSYDTRDRARMFNSLLTSSVSTEMATLVLQAPKPSPVMSLKEKLTDTKNGVGITPVGNLTLGSGSLVVEHPLDGYQPLPPWCHIDQLVNPSVRDEVIPDQPAVNSSSSMAMKNATSFSSAGTATGISSISSANIADYDKKHGVVNGKKLTTQSLDDFFGDVDVPVSKKGVVKEESESGDGDEESESDDEEEEEEYETSSDEEEEEEEESDSDNDEKSRMIK